MASASERRKLVAILAADIVRHSRLIVADEPRPHAQLRAHGKELIEPKIAEYGGRIVQTRG